MARMTALAGTLSVRCTVTVELSKLPDGVDEKQLRDRWAYALTALQEQVDHSWD